MTARGVHFALTEEQLARLLAAAGEQVQGNGDEDAEDVENGDAASEDYEEHDSAVLEVISDIEEAWDQDHLAETDKAWDALHRCLTDGQLLYENGEYPLNHAVCGGRQLMWSEDSDYTVSLVMPEQVLDVAAALEPITQEWLRERYFDLLDPEEYDGEIDEDDFEYTWDGFQAMRTLYLKAAEEGRAVVFSVDC